jgi:hypothetical protein
MPADGRWDRDSSNRAQVAKFWTQRSTLGPENLSRSSTVRNLLITGQLGEEM